jgi:hypothetical protein
VKYRKLNFCAHGEYFHVELSSQKYSGKNEFCLPSTQWIIAQSDYRFTGRESCCNDFTNTGKIFLERERMEIYSAPWSIQKTFFWIKRELT